MILSCRHHNVTLARSRFMGRADGVMLFPFRMTWREWLAMVIRGLADRVDDMDANTWDHDPRYALPSMME